MRNPAFVSLLARSFLAGEQTVEQIVARSSPVSVETWAWLPKLAKKYVDRFVGKTRPRQRDVVDFLRHDRDVQSAARRYGKQLPLSHWLTATQEMLPVSAAKHWNLPPIESIGALAAWLDISVEDLEWFADLKGLVHRSGSPQLSHYTYRVLIKESGNVRLIEAPKSRLRKLQQRILAGILNKIPPHPAVHGFVRGRSIRSCVAVHAGQRVVLRTDLTDFFPSFSARRIQATFRTLGYPEPVADLLGGVCTNFTPRTVFATQNFDRLLSLQTRHWARDLYCRPHLPQGASTSPMLANICSYRLDCRLTGLARAAGATYTRYADDLAFSGGAEFERTVERFSLHVAAICLEEGFHVNHRKTRIMRQGVRQHLVGLVANSHPNIIRADFDRLKATLSNCIRSGPASQNRETHPQFRMHLEGRVAFVESVNAAKGKRLRGLLKQIQWGEIETQ